MSAIQPKITTKEKKQENCVPPITRKKITQYKQTQKKVKLQRSVQALQNRIYNMLKKINAMRRKIKDVKKTLM